MLDVEGFYRTLLKTKETHQEEEQVVDETCCCDQLSHLSERRNPQVGGHKTMLESEETTSEYLFSIDSKSFSLNALQVCTVKGENVDVEKSCQLLDSNEEKLPPSAEAFASDLGIKPDDEVFVCCIVGDVGDGKSHTLNHAFLNKKPVFTMGQTQDPCTKGVWAAYNEGYTCIFLDTEGLSASRGTRTVRLLAKVMAISDVVIYQTRAQRIQEGMFEFLRSAFAALTDHFLPELKKCGCVVNEKGPSVIIYHETQFTEPHNSSGQLRHLLRDWMRTLPDYVGTRTPQPGETNFTPLQNKFQDIIRDRSTGRTRHQLQVLLTALEILNKRFKGAVKQVPLSSFVDECLRCEQECLACRVRCKLSVDHEGEGHQCESSCSKDETLKNFVYLCKKCQQAGEEHQLVPADDNGLFKYLWTGVSFKCSNPKCNVEYHSHKHWYGNKTPDEEGVALLQPRHVWRDGPRPLAECNNISRRMLDGISPQSQTLTERVMDYVNPSYWVPNAEIKACSKCEKEFTSGEQKHHCRACGKGVCDACSTKRRLVPERQWQGEQRVCDSCYDVDEPEEAPDGENHDNRFRTVTDTAIKALRKATEIPKNLVKDSFRPLYWVPDSDAPHCNLCQKPFTEMLTRHHCRSCGQAFCSPCSGHRLPVPTTGWHNPARVCNRCEPQMRIAAATAVTGETEKK